MANRIRVSSRRRTFTKLFWGARANPGRGKVWLIGRTDDGTLDAIEVDELAAGLPYMVPDWWQTTFGPFTERDKNEIMRSRKIPGSAQSVIRRRQEEFRSAGEYLPEPQRRQRVRRDRELIRVGRAARHGFVYGFFHERVSAAARTAAPEAIFFLPLFLAKRVQHGQQLRLFDPECPQHRRAGGCWKRVRVVSRVKTWVRDPARIEFSVRYGLRQTIRINERDIAARVLGTEGPLEP
jgi:hypothetical protein